jgi:hypothetical protein
LLDTGFSNTFPIFLTSFLVFSSSEQKLSVTMKSAHLFFFLLLFVLLVSHLKKNTTYQKTTEIYSFTYFLVSYHFSIHV